MGLDDSVRQSTRVNSRGLRRSKFSRFYKEKTRLSLSAPSPGNIRRWNLPLTSRTIFTHFPKRFPRAKENSAIPFKCVRMWASFCLTHLAPRCATGEHK